MTAANTTEADFAALRDDMLGLKRDVADLSGHMKADATRGVRGTIDGIGDGARRLLGGIAAEGEQSAAAIGRRIEAQPLMALLIAVGIGYAGGRLLSR